MASDLQHCPACQEEYVAGVASCVECGAALQPGPLERLEQRARRGGGSDATAPGAARPDRRRAQMPGLQADHAMRALLLEGITCGVWCEGVEKVYAPGHPPAEPFAVTLPVTVYVTDAQYEAAEEVLASLQHDDVIGEQWSATEVDAENEAIVEAGPAAEPADYSEPARADEPAAADGPSPESTSLRTIVLIVLAAIVLLFVFGR